MCYQILLQTWTQRNGNICKTSENLRRQTVFCQGPRRFSGLRHFQKEDSELKMNLAAEGPQFQKPLKMSLESGILCVHIVARQSEGLGKSGI
ncbi:hypothetical protein TNCV_2960811 [Trichonephila clavipes]|nr:hypothetical protein TNCV_2960811 [Trichonephila clavipes]